MSEPGGYTTIPVDEYHRLLRLVRKQGVALRVIRTWAAMDRGGDTLIASQVIDLCDKTIGDKPYDHWRA
jgi:hypothetical protein